MVLVFMGFHQHKASTADMIGRPIPGMKFFKKMGFFEKTPVLNSLGTRSTKNFPDPHINYCVEISSCATERHRLAVSFVYTRFHVISKLSESTHKRRKYTEKRKQIL
jgi:hypothetical protein